jgi:hypothetical protein
MTPFCRLGLLKRPTSSTQSWHCVYRIFTLFLRNRSDLCSCVRQYITKQGLACCSMLLSPHALGERTNILQSEFSLLFEEPICNHGYYILNFTRSIPKAASGRALLSLPYVPTHARDDLAGKARGRHKHWFRYDNHKDSNCLNLDHWRAHVLVEATPIPNDMRDHGLSPTSIS